MRHLALFFLAALMVVGAADCSDVWLPSLPERPAPESAPVATASSASAQTNQASGPAATATPAQQTPVAAATPAAFGQKTAGSEWIGKTRGEVVKKLGMPLSAVPVDSTGGEMLFYTHYVFESAPGGNIIKVTPVN